MNMTMIGSRHVGQFSGNISGGARSRVARAGDRSQRSIRKSSLAKRKRRNAASARPASPLSVACHRPATLGLDMKEVRHG